MMVLHQLLVQLFLLSFIISYAKGAADWDYMSDDHGPSKWGIYYPKCNGTKQSPINIETDKAKYDQNLGNITFNNYGEPPANVTFTAQNNGHSLGISFSNFTSANEPTIEGGGLPGTFRLLAFHFHWGKNNSDGAEHHLNNDSHACEMHMVHWNTKYSSVDEAKNHTDGLAVLGVFVDVGERNDVFDNFLNMSMYNVTYPNTTATVKSFNLTALLPFKKTFYRYNGSLTTPGCDEVVTWTNFANDISCSEDQINEFRKMMHKQGNETQKIYRTDRPVQPLNGRQVKANFEVPEDMPYATATATATHMPNETATLVPSVTVGDMPRVTTPHCNVPTTTSDSYGISGNLMLMLASQFLATVCLLKM